MTRKKLVDLKAVAALLDDGEQGNTDDDAKKQSTGLFTPDEELIQAARRIKSQRDIINGRVAKMLQSRDKVSKSVFEKVHRDYSLQLDSITKLLNEKKAHLMRELKNLYLLREKQNMEINRHKEILEEARFRNYLEEFSEEQFKEVEEFESREIVNLQADLANINSTIRVHEELFDAEDLGLKAQAPSHPQTAPSRLSPDVTKTMARSAPSPSIQKTTPEHKPLSREPQKFGDDFSDKTPEPSAVHETTPTQPAGKRPSSYNTEPDLEAPATEDEHLPEPDSMHVQTMEPVSRGYFSETSQSSIRTSGKGEAPRKGPAASNRSEVESIFDVLENPPLDVEMSQTASQSGSATAPVDYRPESPPPTAAKDNFRIIFLETDGDLEIQECPLKDNISIGRSPSNDIVLKNPKVSRQHAAINKYKDQYIIIDLKSSNGVFVNGRKIDEQALDEGDEITVGGYKMKFVKA